MTDGARSRLHYADVALGNIAKEGEGGGVLLQEGKKACRRLLLLLLSSIALAKIKGFMPRSFSSDLQGFVPSFVRSPHGRVSE